ncbi:MAG: prepilin-type N-terminal cleavage/methylation domain-containing protein [Spirochaetales bacterium]|nr:prepilin-type N-terminal cleavage/methylation domain-containing protein [Spirochaetales bacterium]
MNTNKGSLKNSWDAGFTLLETLTALVIISTGLMLTFIIGSKIFETVLSLNNTSLFLRELKSCEALLNRETENIILPWWEKGNCLEISPDKVILPYYHGNIEEKFILSFESIRHAPYEPDSQNLALFLKTTNMGDCYFPKLSDGFFFPLGEKNKPIGFGIEFIHEEEVYRLHTLFRTSPLYEVGYSE